MNIATGQTRAALGIATLPPQIRGYIAELELEVGRLQQRSKAHRQNIRSMSSKLRVYHLIETVDGLLAREQRAPHIHITQSQDLASEVQARLQDHLKRSARAV